MRHWFQRQRKICLVFKKHASDRASSYLYNASFQVFLVMPLLWLDQMTIPPLKNANKMEKIIRACLIKVFSRKKIMFTYTSVYITFVRTYSLITVSNNWNEKVIGPILKALV